MKSENEIEDEALGRWLAGQMTEEELKEFEQSEAFKTYQLINSYTQDLELDLKLGDPSFEELKKKLPEKKSETKVVPMWNWRRIAAAASIALIIGLGTVYVFGDGFGSDLTAVYTAQGETKNLELPDQSTVQLNISSSLEYDEDNWKENREVQLKGEAYFKVEKGNRFKVKTSHGSIEVLGTEFNVRNRQNLTEVVCYEGKVRVTDLKNSEIILEPGMAARIQDGELEPNWTPTIGGDADWQNGVSSFHDVPLNTVIEELENQYKLKVQLEADISTRSYVGAFPHDNLEEALRLICEPMNLNYTINSEDEVVIK